MSLRDPASAWTRPRPAPQRRAPGVEEFVAVAIAVADADGLSAVSLRRVASEAGSGTATLYRYIAGRDELLDLMVDTVQGEDPPSPPSGDPHADLEAVAHGLRAGLLRHPWLSGELAGRPTLGPNALRRSEAALRAAAQLTSDFTVVARAVGTLHAYVLGAVATQQAVRQARQRTGLTTEEWTRSVAPYMERVIEAGEHPMLARRVLEAADPDPDADFAFGLTCVLTALVERLSGAGPSGP